MECFKCKHTLPEDSEFCQYCGTKIKKEIENMTEYPQSNYETETQADVNSKRRYCSRCGNLVDNVTKICTGCGKKYFKGIKLNKYTIAVIALSLALVVSVIINIVQIVTINDLNARLDFWYN